MRILIDECLPKKLKAELSDLAANIDRMEGRKHYARSDARYISRTHRL